MFRLEISRSATVQNANVFSLGTIKFGFIGWLCLLSEFSEFFPACVLPDVTFASQFSWTNAFLHFYWMLMLYLVKIAYDLFKQCDKVSDHPSHLSLVAFHFGDRFQHFPFEIIFFKIRPTVLRCIPNNSLTLLLFNPFAFSITIRSFNSLNSSRFFFNIVYISFCTGYRLRMGTRFLNKSYPI